MPAVFLDRLPLPSLQAYTTISVLLLSCSIYYALQATSDSEWNADVNQSLYDAKNENDTDSMEGIRTFLHKMLLKNFITKRLYEVMFFIVEEPLCVWTLINMAYCVLILVGKCIQKFVFGDLRTIEQQHIKDKFWNFVFYKFIFIFGVVNVQYMDEIVVWCGWFSLIGAFHLLSQLCKDRFEYLSFSPTTPKWTHLRLFALIFFILSMSVSMCIIVGIYTNLNTFFFMSAEWTLVVLRTLYVLMRYIIHLYDISHEGIWERRGKYVYYSELVFELSSHVVDFLHHLHMLLWGNIFLSMASLVICMQLRCLFNEIQRKIIRHKNYLNVSKHMENNYPIATKEEIDSNSDDCAICWDKMDSARKLPCGHMFHTSCLHSWLEQVTNCPTCRTPLVQKNTRNSPATTINRNNILVQDGQPRPANQTTNHFFHFDGSRYVSWFPSFSVEFSHTSLIRERQAVAFQTSQMDAMVHQVLQVFPHMPYNIIMDDLIATRSVEQTIENILEERVTAPSAVHFPASSATHSLTSLPSSSSSSSMSSSSLIVPLRSCSIPDGTLPSTSLEKQSSVHKREFTSASTSTDNQQSEIVEDAPVKSGGEGCRFSKSSVERQQMLSNRKEELLKKARCKYINRIYDRNDISSDSSSSE
ncbi:E3 ubiquitin-protein ligase AMFR-like [Uloborus diversus]|uniref:E3 ubiquitin-protein ligase AMFR-like n=1 Tax=Uloborus diversus TaxID=327109 RepID=UPI0024090761|nr:E3 ubiquitin-protein ligase AMFR-like [Uloborus diversus]